MSSYRGFASLFTAIAAVAVIAAAPPEKPADAKSRAFQFTYSTTVTGLKPGEKARVWVPVGQSNDDQDVTVVSTTAPGEKSIGTEKLYGNKILYAEGTANDEGKFGPVEVVYKVTRREVKGDGGKEAKENADLMARYLKPDAKVPIEGKPLDLLAGKELPKDQLGAAKVMYDVIDDTLKYGKDKPGWGNGDSVWACDSKTGNCSDFHSLFISLARSRKIPAKFEIGFPVPTDKAEGEIPGYHCWAKFKPEGSKGWIPVDISEANKNPKMREYYFGNLTADRVALSTGRDLELVPKQDGGPGNFLIYPYVDVDGKAYAPYQIQKKFTFKDEK
jgi:transglutaminase-like putative cysteine protease